MRPQPRPLPAPAFDDVRRILVVANETVQGAVLHDLLLGATGGGRETQVLVIVPALRELVAPRSSGRTEPGDGAATSAASERLRACLAGLAAEGIPVAGRLVDVDPLQAISRTLREFRADLIVIATHPPGRSRWLAHDLVGRADRAFGLPVAHVVVDAAAVGVAA